MRKLSLNSLSATVIWASLALLCLGVVETRAAEVIGGQTSVLLDTATLSVAVSLDLSSTPADVVGANRGVDSVAFEINSRTAALPTTFSYDPAAFPAGGSFSGTIEHIGSVFFNSDTVEVGNFSIGFDAGRVGSLSGADSVSSWRALQELVLFCLTSPHRRKRTRYRRASQSVRTC